MSSNKSDVCIGKHLNEKYMIYLSWKEIKKSLQKKIKSTSREARKCVGIHLATQQTWFDSNCMEQAFKNGVGPTKAFIGFPAVF